MAVKSLQFGGYLNDFRQLRQLTPNFLSVSVCAYFWPRQLRQLRQLTFTLLDIFIIIKKEKKKKNREILAVLTVLAVKTDFVPKNTQYMTATKSIPSCRSCQDPTPCPTSATATAPDTLCRA